LRNARREIAAMNGALPPLRSSAIYETDPVDCEEGAAKFFNAVIEVEYSGPPEELRRGLALIERTLGRPAAHERNVSRPIDLDLLYFGDLVIESGLSADAGAISDYRRELDLDTGVARVKFKQGDNGYRRDYFVSYPDQVLVAR
jgi:2-amino-4-hydroxy-6-hydroxymethyldihydropteridine diphosphokinase